MAKSSGRARRKSDRQRIIEWYKADLEKYRGMIGETTEFNVIVTDKLIKQTEDRISELEEKEERWKKTISNLFT
tara:strand:+ start:6 stop:227 length:222 start_codon:yes stop_codon:yes gene_type:complete